MSYLLKVTIIWAVFLVLFEIVYKKRGRFAINRFLILVSILSGLLLPLIPMPSQAPVLIRTGQSFLNTSPASVPASVQKSPAQHEPIADQSIKSGRNGWPFVYTLYYIGALLLLANCLVEVYKIRRLVSGKSAKTIYGYKVISTGKSHAPYSFMSYIFMENTEDHTPADLKYIIRHEAAHYERKHWLDLWLIQLLCIVFWFHPLVWRYKYLLRMQQEFEADEIASQDDAYNYGHFLLRQTLLSGVPSIAHSFHFSSIKNRITMLTKKQGSKASSKLYLLFVPVLLGCTLLSAKDTESQNSITIYNGNTFKWRYTDTLYYDKTSQKTLLAQNSREKRQIAYSLNNEPVYRNEYLQTPASYGDSATAYGDYVRNQFTNIVKNTTDSNASVSLSDLVINKEGKVVSYRVHYWHKPYIAGLVSNQDWNLFHDLEPKLDSIVEKIISEGPKWRPATINGKPVNSLATFFWGC